MNEMSEQARPVRAWAEYDEIALFWHEDDAQTWLTPKGEGWYPSRFDDVPWIVATMEQLQVLKRGPGPLRSLRVLLSTGHEVSMDCCVEDGYCIDGTFTWELRDGQQWPCGGSITDLSDADAVALALAEAVAWIREQEGVPA